MTSTTPAQVDDPWATPDDPTPEPEKPSVPTEEPPPAGEPPVAPTAPTAPPATKKKAAAPTKRAPAKKTVGKRLAEAVQAVGKPAEPEAIGELLDDRTTFVSVLYYGPEGTGKTTDALRMTRLCGPDQRVLFIDAEAGAKVRALKDRGVDTSKIEVWPRQADGGPAAVNFEGLFDVADRLAADPERYVGWIWDSGTEITKRLLDEVTADARAKDERIGKARGRFQINLEDHGVASSMLRELLRKFRDLPMHGVITALERRDVDEDTGKVRYGPAMSPAMANDAAGLIDIVAYKVVEAVGSAEIRSARFTPVGNRRAKDRYGVMPGKLADPYFDRLVAYVNGDLDRTNDPVQAHVRELAAAAAPPPKKAAAKSAAAAPDKPTAATTETKSAGK